MLISIPVHGVTVKDRFVDDHPEEPWHIEADEITYDDRSARYSAKGHVVISKKDKKVTADHIRFDHRTMKIFASGHVIMAAGDDVLTASRMEVDLKSETGTLYDGTIFIKENQFSIKGNKIQKIGPQMYAAEKASISTCAGDRPAWKITGRNLKVTIEGHGSVNHAALWLKNVPVLYSPYLIFPIKIKRQTGLLTPEFGISERKGSQFAQPFYWAINRSSDMTFYAHYMSRRGTKFGMEHRYVSDLQSRGAMMVDLFEDRKVDDPTLDSSGEWGYAGDNIPRTNSDRYWLRGKHDKALARGWDAKLDLDLVSDQDYLTEFRFGYNGFVKTDAYFYERFGRGLNPYDDPVRTNLLNLNKTWTQYNLNTEARWHDDVIARQLQLEDTTVQRLPLVDFFAAKQQPFGSPLFFGVNSRYDHLYRKDGPRGHRVDIFPRVYLPARFKKYLFFEPSAGFRGTAWSLDETEHPADRTEKRFHRGMVDLRADLFSEIHRIYRGKADGVARIKHAVRPEIVYEYVPEKNQDKYPVFDAVDRILEKNLITFSLINTLVLKSKTAKPNEDAPESGPHSNPDANRPGYHYKPVCRFELSQQYDIREAREDDPAKWANKTSREPFLPLYGEIELIPAYFLSLRADAQWSYYGAGFLSENIALTATDGRGDRAFVEHRFSRDSVDSIYANLLYHISGRVSASAEYERNLLSGERIRLGFGLGYTASCWSVDFRFLEETGDRKFLFRVNLSGLGGISQRF
jgi:LPS-assembly protein